MAIFEDNNENKVELSQITLEICNRLEEYKSNITSEELSNKKA